ncbi:glutamate synthase-related protein, partial [Clostridioides difficile]|uniref:glutamate synthase-related protein n=1 Tax=Clostridioides difficile TaxID=1496 RepID=UPI0020B218EA
RLQFVHQPVSPLYLLGACKYAQAWKKQIWKEKVDQSTARVRNKPVGQDVISPSCFEEIQSKEDLKKLVDELREVSEGRPIG